MIDWMQRHKKSLIPTIWISTIAFVGAGVVGWGAYDYNRNRAGAVAVVGDIKISNQDFNMKYNDIYNFYRTVNDGKFTDEQAKEMKLANVTLDALVREGLLLNLAKELGLEATKNDITTYLLKSPEFQLDGKFNKKLYDQSVKNLGITKSEFERDLARKLTLEKLATALHYKPANDIFDAFVDSQFQQYHVFGEVVEYKENNETISDDEIKSFWENEKEHYLTKKTYEIDTVFVEPVQMDVNNTVLNEYYNEHRNNFKTSDGKIQTFDEALDFIKHDYLAEFNKNNADKMYLEVKKGNKALDKKMVVSEDNFPISVFDEAKIDIINKPFSYENGNLITKIIKINEPKPMEFEQAKPFALQDLKVKIKNENLKKIAENKMSNFNGKDFGFIGRDSLKNIENISEVEFAKFLDKLFKGNEKKDFILFDDKAFVYEVRESKLGNTDKIDQYKDVLKKELDTMINQNLTLDLIQSLSKRYKIEYFRKLQ